MLSPIDPGEANRLYIERFSGYPYSYGRYPYSKREHGQWWKRLLRIWDAQFDIKKLDNLY